MYILNEFSPIISSNLQRLIDIASRHNVGMLTRERQRNNSSGLSLCVCKSNNMWLGLMQYIKMITRMYDANGNNPTSRFLSFKLIDNNLFLYSMPIKKYPSANMAVFMLQGAIGLPEIMNIDDKHNAVIQ